MPDGYWVESHSFILDYHYPNPDSPHLLSENDLRNTPIDQQLEMWLTLVASGFTNFGLMRDDHADRVGFLKDHASMYRFATIKIKNKAPGPTFEVYVAEAWLRPADTILYKMKFNPHRNVSRIDESAERIDEIITVENV